MKKNIFLIAVCALLVSLSSSCKEDELTYTGSAVIEFSPYKSQTINVQEFDDGHFISEFDAETRDSIMVSLVAPHFSKDITCKFEVLDVFYYIFETGKIVTELPDGITEGEYDEYETTAVEGEDFNFVTDREFTIPANSSFGFIDIETSNTTGDGLELLLMLVPSNDIGVSENYKYYRLEIDN